jgi:hypothetical protein
VVIAVDKEELRVDRAVKVSRKELNLLVAELLDCTDMLSSDDEDIRTQQQECPLPPEQEEPVLVEVRLKHDCNFLLFVCSQCVISLERITWFQDFVCHLVL